MEFGELLTGLKDVLPALTEGVRGFVRSQAALNYILPDFSAELRHTIAGLVFLSNATSLLSRTITQTGGIGSIVSGLLGAVQPGGQAQAAAGAASSAAAGEPVTIGGVRLTAQQVAAFAGQSSAFSEAIGAGGAGAASAAGAAAGVGGGAAAGTAGVAGAAAGTAALGPLVIAAAAVVAGLTVATLAIKSFSQSVLDANRGLADFSGAMAAVFAQSDVRDIQRSMKAGDEQAGSARFLAEGLSDLKDTLQPIGTMLANILNIVGGVLARVLNVLLKPLQLIAMVLNPILDALVKLLEWLGLKLGDPDEQDSQAFGDWLNDIAQMSRTAQARKDPRFGYR